MYEELPLLPGEVDIILLRPSNTDSDDRLIRVRRHAIETWLHFLRENHPGYSGITISSDRIQNLPDDSSVIDDILTQSTDPDPNSSTETDVTEEIDAPVSTAVPNFIPDRTELDAVRNMLPPPNALALPPFRSTPINDSIGPNPSSHLHSLPYFLTGEPTRQRSVSYKDYIRHLIKHESVGIGTSIVT